MNSTSPIGLSPSMNLGPSDLEMRDWWYSQGCALNTSETIPVNGRRFNRLDCFRAALELDPDFASAWLLLGDELFPGQTVTIRSEEIEHKECYARALSCNLNDEDAGSAWLTLAFIVTDTGPIEVKGEMMNCKECLIQSLHYRPDSPPAWVLLSIILTKGETIELHGNKITRRECCIKALQSRSLDAQAWVELGREIPSGISVEVNGKQFDRLACFIEAKRLNPQIVESLYIELSGR